MCINLILVKNCNKYVDQTLQDCGFYYTAFNASDLNFFDNANNNAKDLNFFDNANNNAKDLIDYIGLKVTIVDTNYTGDDAGLHAWFTDNGTVYTINVFP